MILPRPGPGFFLPRNSDIIGVMNIGRKIVRLNRKYPWAKIFLSCAIILTGVMGAGMSSVQRGQTVAKLADTGVGQDYSDTFKIVLAGEETEVSGLKDFEESVKNSEQELEPVDLTGKQLVALTFDDGPDAEATSRILNTLKEKSVKATFFMVGIMIQRAPEIAKQVAEAGHEVETHSMRHANLSQMSGDAVVADLAEARQVLKDATGVDVELLRPPYGEVNDTVKGAAGMAMISWSVDPADWQNRDSGLIRDRVVEDSFDGAVILLHDVYTSTAEALGGLIDGLRQREFEFVTVKEMAKIKGVELTAGSVYRDFAD